MKAACDDYEKITGPKKMALGNWVIFICATGAEILPNVSTPSSNTYHWLKTSGNSL